MTIVNGIIKNLVSFSVKKTVFSTIENDNKMHQ